MLGKPGLSHPSDGPDMAGARPSRDGASGPVTMARMLVIAPNLHWRRTGVTTSILSLLPRQCRDIAIAAVGPLIPPDLPRLPLWRILLGGWRRPDGHANRIWHARRNDEMIVGILLKHVLRQPWSLMFTSAAQRRHSRFTHWLLDRMEVIVATSPGAAEALGRPVVVIPHGVDTHHYRPAADRDAAWRETGLPGTTAIGCFGRIRPQKGTDLFVEALIQVLPDHPGVTGIVTGLALGEFRSFEAGLKARVTAAGLADRILFLGERPADEMPLWFRRIACYVAPPRQEGFGLTVLEAMASAAAVVATRTGAAADLVVEGMTGHVVPPDDLGAMVAAIRSVLADPDRMREMGRRGHAKAVAEHEIQAEAVALIRIYRRLLKPRDGAPGAGP